MSRNNHPREPKKKMSRPREHRVARQPFIVIDGTGIRRLSGPAVVMENPKHVVNIASMIRNCAAFGVSILCYTGDRVDIPTGKKSDRLPREERMREYETVQVIHHDFPLHLFNGKATPVAVEIMPGAVPLPYYEHPEEAIYVLGPEDGSISTGLRAACHHFVTIPSIHCLNVAQAGGTVLYDRVSKLSILPKVGSNPT